MEGPLYVARTGGFPHYYHSVSQHPTLDRQLWELWLYIEHQFQEISLRIQQWEPLPCPDDAEFVTHYEPVTVIVPKKDPWWKRPPVEIPASLNDPGL